MIYRQFSITIVSAMALSVVVALVLTPALCATLLKPIEKGHHDEKTGFFGWFNRSFNDLSSRYQGSVRGILGKSGRYMAVYAAIIVAMGLLFVRLPSAFLPDEDQGIMITLVQLPAGAPEEKTLAVLDKVREHFLVGEKNAVQSVFTVSGFSFAGAGQNAGLAFVRLKDFDHRKTGPLKAQAVAGRAMAAFSQIRDAMVFAVIPPAVPELGTSSGFDFQLQDISGVGHDTLMQARNMMLGMASKDPNLVGVRPNGQDDTP